MDGNLAGKVRDLSVVDLNWPFFGGDFSNDDIQKALDRWGERFAAKILVEQEMKRFRAHRKPAA